MSWGRALWALGALGMAVVPGAVAERPRMCDGLQVLEGVQQELARPGVFELDTAALDDVLARRRQAQADIAHEAEDPLRWMVDRLVEAQDEVDAAMLDGWEDERAELNDPDDDGLSWLYDSIGDPIPLDDGETVRLDAHVNVQGQMYERLVVECRAPELADGPPVDTSETPPPGTVVFFRVDDSGETGELVRIDSDGDREQELDAPSEAIGQLDALPTGRGGMLVGLHEGDEYRTIVIDQRGRELDSIQRSSGQLICPAWNPTADVVLALANGDQRDQRQLHLIDLTGETPSRPLDLPFAAVGCGAFLDDDRLVVADAALDPDDTRGVWTVGIDGSDPEQVYVPDRCGTQVGSVAPDGRRVALGLNCADPLASGVYVLDLATGDTDHIATGLPALPKWSTDGEWLVFGFRPIAEHDEGVSIWLARADGTQLRQLAGPGPSWSSFPVWLPPMNDS